MQLGQGWNARSVARDAEFRVSTAFLEVQQPIDTVLSFEF
jgi:hypothetical protein